MSEILERVKYYRRELHKLAELAYCEWKTSEFICSQLSEMGIAYRKVGTGVLADIEGEDGYIIALRADMDALPICENSGVDFTSQNNGVMHACGHDAHMAMLLTAAKLFCEKKPRNSVRLIFQPAEEGEGGALTMIEGGALEGVSEIYALHVDPELDGGKLASRKGAMMAGTVEFDMDFKGRSCHIARREMGRDALGAAIEYVRDAMKCAGKRVRLHYGLLKGGSARNIVAAHAHTEGTLRFFTEEDLVFCENKIDAVAEAVSEKYNVEWEKKVIAKYIPVICDADAFNKVNEICPLCIAEKRFTAEDFAFYLEKKRGALIWLGIKEYENQPLLHSENFVLDETHLQRGVQLYEKLVNAPKKLSER